MTSETMTMLKEALDMFLFLAFELTLLFLAISYLVGILQSYIPPEKIQSILSSRQGKGYIIAGLLGAITPLLFVFNHSFSQGAVES